MTISLNEIAATILVAASLAAASPAAAQETRGNPFLPNPTTDEERINAERERFRQSIREMMPEIKSLLAPSFAEERIQTEERAKKAALDELRNSEDFRKLIEAQKSGAAAAQVAGGKGGKGDPKKPGGPGGPQVSENKLVACLNGKGLYRDKNGTSFIDESGEIGGDCS